MGLDMAYILGGNVPSFANKKVSVLGLGISNRPLIDWLLARGAEVTAHDKKSEEALGEVVAEMKEKGVELVTGEEYLDKIDGEIIFRSPGIRYDHPGIARAVEQGAILTSEMELFFALCPCKIVGITGSDGKTTTTTLTAKILEQSGKRVYLGGNIGAPLLPRLHEMTEDDVAVVELSSFQLHTMRESPDVSVITNLSPNHLDYHHGMDEYIEAKTNIYRYQTEGGKVVLNYKNPVTRALCYGLAAAGKSDALTVFCGPQGDSLPVESGEGWAQSVLTPSGRFGSAVREVSCAHSAYLKDGVILLDGTPVLKAGDIIIPGAHNVENYMTAIAAVTELLGYTPTEAIRTVATSFPGVPHRNEFVRELDGVRYYNSSIDSSPTRTAAALYSFKEKPVVICGGYDKNIPFAPLAETLCDKAKAVVLTGATADKIGTAIEACPSFAASGLRVERRADFKEALEAARAMAEKGDVVILSPACASFDAFRNFEERGQRFKDIVLGW